MLFHVKGLVREGVAKALKFPLKLCSYLLFFPKEIREQFYFWCDMFIHTKRYECFLM